MGAEPLWLAAIRSSHSSLHSPLVISRMACTSPFGSTLRFLAMRETRALQDSVCVRRSRSRRDGLQGKLFELRAKSGPCRTRTCDLLVRSQTLYPTELRAPTGGNQDPNTVQAAHGRAGRRATTRADVSPEPSRTASLTDSGATRSPHASRATRRPTGTLQKANGNL